MSATVTTIAAARPMGRPLIKRVSFEAPWMWLAAGWRDLWTFPAISLAYGAVCVSAAIILLAALFDLGWQSAVPALAGGFLLVGPMLAVGLYEKSRRLEAGEAVTASDVALVGVRSPGQLAMIGLGLTMVYFAWLLLAFLLFAVFLGPKPLPPAEDFVPALLFTANGLGLLITGTIAGAALAALVFALTAVSVPLLMARDLDMVTAVGASLAAVRANLKPMALWAALIAGMVALGFVTLLMGLVVVFPLIGHATWHAYRDLIGFADEPETLASSH